MSNIESSEKTEFMNERPFIKFIKGSSTTNGNGRWWLILQYNIFKLRGSKVIWRGIVGNGKDELFTQVK